MIVWLIGISGAGKTTVAKVLHGLLHDRGRPVVLLDGDELRHVWGDELGHELSDRRRNHQRISRLCALLGREARLDIVVPALSIFPDLRAWNRANLPSYFEVFLDVPLAVAEGRDPKGIYARARRGEIQGVAGIDIPFPPPDAADLVIRPPEVLAAPEIVAQHILTHMAKAA